MPEGLPQRVAVTPIHEHVERLRREFPTLTMWHLAVVAGVPEGVAYRLGVGSVHTAAVEHRDALLAVTVDDLRANPPAYLPAAPVVAHLRRLLRHPDVTVIAIAARSGISKATIHHILSEDRPTMREYVAESLLGVSAAMVAPKRPRYVADPAPTVTRIRALMANGWSIPALSRECGIPVNNILYRPDGRMSVDRADRVAAMFERLGDRPGGCVRARKAAVALGYRPPIHYDDDMHLIPDAAYDGASDQDDARMRLRVLALSLQGLYPREIAQRIGASADHVSTIRSRGGLRATKSQATDRPRFHEDARYAAALDAVVGIDGDERTEMYDDPDIDYVARWTAVSTTVSTTVPSEQPRREQVAA